MRSAVPIETPDGDRSILQVEPQDGDTRLSAWLERRGIPLNTRCGQTGLCKGCVVEIETSDHFKEQRSCQIHVAELPVDLVCLRVPANSWRDRSLRGVSTFEIHTGQHSEVRRSGYGIAFDIGTTTVAAALWDLAEAKCLGATAQANAQTRYGDNVLTRINHASASSAGSVELQRALIEDSLAPLMEELCSKADLSPEAITEATATGNTVMLHTLAGASLDGFRKYPFRPIFTQAQTIAAKDLGFASDFPIRCPPSPGAFVGSDITAGAWAAGLLERGGPALLIDFGTNGEIVLQHGNGYLATATAAGPAFEGGRLRCGAIAGENVISSFKWADDAWSWLCSDGTQRPRPKGISGAAYVDFIAHSRSRGLLDSMGRFAAKTADVKTRAESGETQRYIEVAPQLTVSERDIAEIIQAKAAIVGGIMTLLEMARLNSADLTKIYIAGGFGYHLDLASATAVGLIPAVPLEHIEVIGNASLGGASLYLQSAEGTILKSFLDACQVIELNQCETFEEHFIDGMPLEAIA